MTSGFSHFKCVSCVVDDFLKKKYVPYFWEDSGCDYTRGPDVLKIKFVTRNAGQLVLVQCRCLALISRESSWCHIHWHMQGSVHVIVFMTLQCHRAVLGRVCDCVHMHACRRRRIIGLCCTTGNNRSCALLTCIVHKHWCDTP